MTLVVASKSRAAGCTGNLGIIVIFPESAPTASNHSENWSREQVDQVLDEIYVAAGYWVNQAAASGTFLSVTVTDIYYPDEAVIDHEPIALPKSAKEIWIEAALNAVGFDTSSGGTTTNKILQFQTEHWQGTSITHGATVFVVNDTEDTDKMFADGTRAAVTVAGTYIITTLNNGVSESVSYGVEHYDWVFAHELGHICGAPDEYSPCACSECTRGHCNFNCVECEAYPQVKCLMWQNSTTLRPNVNLLENETICYHSQGMVGWDPQLVSVGVGFNGDGDGAVTSTPDGIDCRNNCSEDFLPGTEVTLNAVPDPGSVLTGWSSLCETNPCRVTANSGSDYSRTVTFSLIEGPQQPSILTGSSANVGGDSTNIFLSVNPKGSATSSWFRWGETEGSLPYSVPQPPYAVGAGDAYLQRSYTLANLDCDTRYYYRAVADGFGQPVYGEPKSFRTTACDSGGGGGDTGLIENGDFSNDDDHWTTTGAFQADDRFNSSRSDPGYAYLAKSNGDRGNSLSGALYQEVTLPPNVDTATLEFWYWIATNEPAGAPPGDVLLVSIRDEDGDILQGLRSYTNWDAYAGGYRRADFDLSQYAGETIQVHFNGTTNSSYPTVFRLDDVSLTVTYDDGGGSGGGGSYLGFDLEASNPWADDETPRADSTIDFGFTTANIGDRTAPDDVRVDYYLNGEIVTQGSEYGLEPGETDSEDMSILIPNEAGSYEVWACLESFPDEPNTTNNCTSKIDLEVWADPDHGPDFVIVDITTTKTTLLAGEEFDMTATVRNVGDDYVLQPILVRFLATLDGNLDHEDLMLEADTINAPYINEERTANETMEAPLEPGTYLLGACVKFLSNEETDITNNCSPDPFILTVLPNGCQPETVDLSGIVVTSTEVYDACQWIEAGPSTWVEAGGDLDLTAPRVVFHSGFSVAPGGTLKVFTGPAEAALFEDDFDDNEIDPSKWTTSRNRVLETNGEFRVETTVTDQGGRAETAQFAVDPERKLVLSRKAKLHYANDYFGATLNFNWQNFPEHRFRVSYSNYSYQGGNSCPRYGVAVSRSGAGSHGCSDIGVDISDPIPAIWDEWFNERIVYDPQTGTLDYFTDGALQLSYDVGSLPDGATLLSLAFDASGWHTGHYHYTDDFVISQE